MRAPAEMHALKNYNLVQATLSSIIIVTVVSGSITSRCSGNEPALLGEVQESGENRAHGSISVLFNCLLIMANFTETNIHCPQLAD